MEAGKYENSFSISRLDEFDAIRDRMKQLMEESGYSEAAVSEVAICFEEMVINAISHGNNDDPAKKAHIDFSVSEERVEIVIEDEGPGFDPDTLDDPTDIERLKEALMNNEEDVFMHGRGIFLTRKYMNEVTYNNKGNRVTLVREFS
jgi:serine/threonine-protein kinase RsbW